MRVFPCAPQSGLNILTFPVSLQGGHETRAAVILAKRSNYRARNDRHQKILWAKLDSDRCPWQSEVATQTTLEAAMKVLADRPEAPSAIHTDLRAIFVSMELSRSSWLITSVSPGGGEKMSKHAVAAGNIAGLREWLAQLKEKAHARTGRDYQIITIQEAGLDGFWIHRVLQSECIERSFGRSAAKTRRSRTSFCSMPGPEPVRRNGSPGNNPPRSFAAGRHRRRSRPIPPPS